MTNSAVLRALVTQRLTAAAEDICALFERTMAEYEQEVLLLTHNKGSQQQSHDLPTGVQVVSMKEEEPEEQLKEQPFAAVCVKIEDDEDESSVLHQRPTEEDREETDGSNCGAGSSSDPLTQSHSDSEAHTDSSNHTDHSEEYSQEQAEPKRSYAMIPPDSRVTDHKSFSCSDQGPFICSECGGIFKRSRDLNRHMLVHVGEKPFVCSVCDKAFAKKSDMARHQALVHNFCSLCSKRFSDRDTLNVHLRTHVEDGSLSKSSALFTETGRPFTCTECGKRFRANSYLQRHMLVHTDERPHKCLVCEKCFKDTSQLKKHLIRCRKRFTTDGDVARPFLCSICGKSFISKAYLTSHKNRFHHTCALCTTPFTNEIELKAHLRTHVQDGTL